jgi:hypothetical protein
MMRELLLDVAHSFGCRDACALDRGSSLEDLESTFNRVLRNKKYR